MECRLTKSQELRIRRGGYVEVLDDYFDLLSYQRITLGNYDRETLWTRTRIALVYEKAGRLDRALEELQSISNECESQIPYTSNLHISHLHVKYRMANVLENLGQEIKGREMKKYVEETFKSKAGEFEFFSKSENVLNYFRTVKRYRHAADEILGPDHEASLRLSEVVGDIYRSSKDYNSAWRTYNHLLDVKVNIIQSKDCIPLCIKLASLEVQQGQYERALSTFEQISQEYESCEITDYIPACEIDKCIANTYQKLGKQSKAEEALNSVKLRLKAYADKFVELSGILSTEFYSEICRERCREIAEKEFDLVKKGFDYMRSVLPPHSEDTLRLGSVAAFMCRLLEKYGDSLELYEQVYERSFRHFGANHSLTINSCLDRVSLLRSLSRLQEAFTVLNDFNHERNTLLGITKQTHDDVTLKIQYESANIFYQQGTYAQAQDVYNNVSRACYADAELKLDARRMLMKASYEVGHRETTIVIIKEFYDEFSDLDRLNVKHLQKKGIVRFLCDIADINEQRGEYDSAVMIYESMNGICRAKGVNFPLHMETKIAIIRAKQNKDDDYVAKFRGLVTKCREIDNPGHFLTTSIRKGLLMAYFRRNDIPSACSVFSRILSRSEHFLGSYHSDTLSAKYLMAKCLLRAAVPHQFERLKLMFEEIRELKYAVHYPYHPHCLSVSYYLAVINEKMGYLTEAFKIYCDIYSKTQFFYGDSNPYLNNIRIRIDSIAISIQEPDLISATDRASLHEVQSCLRYGDDVNVRGTNGFTPLHIAAVRGYINILKCLLQHGASYKITNWEWKTPVDIACHHEIKRIFRQADHLFSSIKHNDIESVKRIIRRDRALVNAKDENGVSPLHCACFEGYNFIVQFLLESGADVKSRAFRGYLAFHLAAIKGHDEIIMSLVNYIEDNIREDLLEMFNDNKNDEGSTPLHLAAVKNRVHTVRLLRGNPAYREKRDKLGKLPVDLAVGSEVKDFLKS